MRHHAGRPHSLGSVAGPFCAVGFHRRRACTRDGRPPIASPTKGRAGNSGLRPPLGRLRMGVLHGRRGSHGKAAASCPRRQATLRRRAMIAFAAVGRVNYRRSTSVVRTCLRPGLERRVDVAAHGSRVPAGSQPPGPDAAAHANDLRARTIPTATTAISAPAASMPTSTADSWRPATNPWWNSSVTA